MSKQTDMANQMLLFAFSLEEFGSVLFGTISKVLSRGLGTLFEDHSDVVKQKLILLSNHGNLWSVTSRTFLKDLIRDFRSI